MDKKSKVISGLRKGYEVVKPNKHFSDLEKHKIIQEFLSGKFTKREIWFKYTGHEEEHGHLLRWMQNLGYETRINTRSTNFDFMATIKATDNPQKYSFENLQLKKRIADLEKQLGEAEMKAIAFSTMLDIAEKEFNIPIRKKHNTKPLKP